MSDDREAERARKLAKKPTKSAFDVDKEQLKRQKEKDARKAADDKPKGKSPTSDLSVLGAVRNLNEIKLRRQSTDSNN